MKREFLKAMGLTDEQIDSIMSEHGNTVNSIKSERDNLVTERDGLKDEIKNRDGQIKTLEKTVGSAEDTQKELQRVKDENAKWESKYAGTLLDANIKLAVAKEANDAGDILYFIKKDGLKLTDDGKVEGLEAEVKRLKEEKPYLFTKVEGNPEGTNGTDGKDDLNNSGTYTPPAGQGNKPKDVQAAELGKQDALRYAPKTE